MGSSLVHYFCLISFLLLLHFTNVQSYGQKTVFNVNNYGAIGDGKTDNTKAFLSAWTDACANDNSNGSVVLVPLGTYLLNAAVFLGPCKNYMIFVVNGRILAHPYKTSWGGIDHWIAFRHVDNLVINGGGSFDGQGASAWPYNPCSKNSTCPQLPISLRLDFVNHTLVSHIRLINSKYFHMSVFACNDVHLDHIHIIAPKTSPNTDGIHVARTAGFRLSKSTISTGDDCVSFGPGTSDVEISEVNCGPGHGISIGSLGKNPDENDVSNFLIRNCSISGTQNGVRIKTWGDKSFPLNVYNLTFENITMSNVNNPVIIDQEYCPSRQCSKGNSSQVQIRDVKFRHIKGTSSSKVAVNFLCSKSKPCKEIEMRNIRLVHERRRGHVTSHCQYAYGVAYGYQQPSSCLT